MNRRTLLLTCLLILAPLGTGGSSLVAGTAVQHAEQESAGAVRFVLPNGLRVWVQEDHRRPVVLVQTSYRVGSLNDGPGITGTAHYVEHMVYRATENISNEDIYGFVDRIGGRWTGGTEPLATIYGETAPSWALEELLRITAERMGRARFDSTEFERERSNVATEANGFSDTGPVDALRDAVMLTSFEVHPYRYGSNTWVRDNLDLTRAQAYDFYQRFYGPNNAVLTVVGDVTVDSVRSLVEKHFGPLGPAPETGLVRIVEPPQQVEKRVTLVHPVDSQRVEIVYRAPAATSPDYPVLVVLDRVLRARLERAVGRVGGRVSTSHGATPYPHVYRISAATSPAVDVERLLQSVDREIERLHGEPVAAQELEAARSEPGDTAGRLAGAVQPPDPNRPPRAFPGLAELARELDRREVFPWEVGPERLGEIRRAQADVTAAQVRTYAGRWLRPSQRTVGLLESGPSDDTFEWTDGRPMVNGRLEMPAMTVPPAKRARPTPVPPRALEPLAPLGIETARRVLSNGVVVRAARTTGAATALQVRFAPGGETLELSLLAARVLVADPALASVGTRAATASLANDGFFDITVNVMNDSLDIAVAAVARAPAVTTAGADRVERERARLLADLALGGGRSAGGEDEARDSVLAMVDPTRQKAGDRSREALARIAPAEIDRFFAQRLVQGPVTVSLVAQRDPAALLELAAEAFGRWPARPPAPNPPASPSLSPAITSTIRAQEVRVPRASAPQVAVVAGLPGVPRSHRDRRALQLLNYIVGVPYYGGRLGWALTKSGLTYSSAASTISSATSGHIVFSTDCDTRNLEATLQAVREVVAGVGESGVSEWELREAQAFTLGRTLLYGPREDSEPEAIARALLDSQSWGEDVLDLRGLSRATLAVTLEEINAVARRYYRPERLGVAAIGAVPNVAARSAFAPGTFRALFDP